MATKNPNAKPVADSKPNSDALPESVKLAAPHGFYDEAGDLQAWLANEIVTDKKDIALLIERGARLFGIGDEPAEPVKAA